MALYYNVPVNRDKYKLILNCRQYTKTKSDSSSALLRHYQVKFHHGTGGQFLTDVNINPVFNGILMQINKNILFFIFSMSGFSGLLYESIWSHYVKLILGHAAYSQTLVLIIFMGGMAIGSWFISLFSQTIKNPLLSYAIIESIIGILGLIFHNEFIFMRSFLFEIVLPNIDNAILNSSAKWLLASVLLLPQAILLGMTFPIMSSAIIRLDPSNSGHTLGMLYFSNSMGAAIGVLCSGFILIEWVGLPGTILTAGCINILIASSVWLISKDTLLSSPVSIIQNASTNNTGYLLLLVISLLTGMTSFFYEIGWIRMLSLVLSSSIQAFELMLSAFITGITFGSYFIRKRIDKLHMPEVFLAWVQIIMGLLAAATLPVYIQSFSLMSFLFNGLAKTNEGYSLFNFSSQFIALLIMMPTTFMAGMTLPLLTNTLFRSGRVESAIGQIYAANTLGAIIGVILSVHFIMPILGLKLLILTGALIDILLGIIILVIYLKQGIKKYNVVRYLVMVAIMVIGFTTTVFDEKILASGVYRFGNKKLDDTDKLLFYKDGKTASVALIEHADGSLSIRTNGKTDALVTPANVDATHDESTMIAAAMLPLVLKPEAKQIANIGIGSGLTSHALLSSDTIQNLDTIEIEAAMVEGAKGFGNNVERVFNDPRSKIYIDDAKAFFSNKKSKYDIIVSEPSNPWMNGIASLFSYEFYTDIQKYLNDDGIFVQWLQLYEINIENVSSVIKALTKAFPHIRIYNTNQSDLLIIASKDNKLNHLDDWVFQHEKTKAMLHRIGIKNIADFNIRYLGDKNTLAPLFSLMNAPINSDYFPYLAYKAPKARYLQEKTADLSWLRTMPIPMLHWLNGKIPQDDTNIEGKNFDFYDYKKVALKIINDSKIDNQKIEYARAITHNCQSDKISELTKISVYEIIAETINSYLSTQQLNQYWENVIKECHVETQESSLSGWLQLHHAIGQRNEIATLQYAEQLINNFKDFTPSQHNYVLTALLTAAITSANYDKARYYIQQFHLIQDFSQQPLAIKLLVSLILSNEQSQKI